MATFIIVPAKYCNAGGDATIRISDITDVQNLGLKGTQLDDAFRIKYGGNNNLLVYATNTPGQKRNPKLANEIRDEVMSIWKGKDIVTQHINLE